MASADEDEWEYEYDETETEDFYITLDLSNAPAVGSFKVRGNRAGHPVRLRTRLRQLTIGGRREPASVEEPTNEPQTSNVGEMQITGLHTSNPLVMYNGQLLSCKWASTIGTDLFFVTPNAETETPDQPLRSLPAVDLLAMSSTKLTANVAVLRPRDSLFEETQDSPEPAADAMEISEYVASTAGETRQSDGNEAQPPVEESRPAPLSFLAKLNQAKAKRGESSRLVVSKTSTGTRVVAQPVEPTSREETAMDDAD